MATTMAEKLNKEGGKVEDVAMGAAEAAVELVQLQTAYAFSTPLLEKAGEHAKAGMGWLQNALGTVTGTQKVRTKRLAGLPVTRLPRGGVQLGLEPEP